MKIKGRPGAKWASPESIWHAPAVQALFLQIASFCIVLLAAFCLDVAAGLSISILVAALAQGSIAAGFSFWRKLASWWLLIQFLFPVVLVLTLSLQLPPSLFLAAFFFFLVVYWSTFRTQVPYYPSRLPTWRSVSGLLPQDGNVRFIDIGSGLGGLTLHLARQYPNGRFVGIEIAPLPWMISSLRAWWMDSPVRFERGDYRLLDFADYDVIFAYLSPVAMPDLWQKARAEMRSGSLLLSHEFPVLDVPPTMIISPDGSGADLYCWRI